MSILIGESGQVLWSMVEDSDLEPDTADHVREKFHTIRFTPPRVRGLAVSTLIHVEIEINRESNVSSGK